MKALLSLLTLIGIVMLSGCSKSASEKLVSKANTFLFKGSVLLVDEGNVFKDKSGMTVTLLNSNPLISTVTDSLGEFELTIDSSLATFALAYSKPMYGTYKRFFEKRGDTLFAMTGDNYESSPRFFSCGNGKDILYSTSESLGYKSTVTVNSLQLYRAMNGKFFLKCNISSPNLTGEKFIRLFYQKNFPNISFTTVSKTTKNMGMPIPVQNGDNVIPFCTSCFYQCADLQSGDTVYLTAYGDSFYSNLYTEKSTNEFIMPNVNTTNNPAPVSFILP